MAINTPDKKIRAIYYSKLRGQVERMPRRVRYSSGLTKSPRACPRHLPATCATLTTCGTACRTGWGAARTVLTISPRQIISGRPRAWVSDQHPPAPCICQILPPGPDSRNILIIDTLMVAWVISIHLQ